MGEVLQLNFSTVSDFPHISVFPQYISPTIFLSIMNFVQFKLVVTISLLGHVNCENVTFSEFDDRAAIINGYNAPERPFYVKILLDGWFTCGGTLIEKNFVLSAAHCFYDKDYKGIDVLLSDFTDPNSELTLIPTRRLIINPGYNGQYDQGNDVAVLKLYQSVSSSRILPMCTKSYSKYTIGICGMGRTVADVDATQLQETKQEEKSSCSPFDNIFDKNKQVCLAPINSTSYSGPCFGDSGGPAYPLSHGIVMCVYGIASYVQGGNPPCRGNSVYTRVSAYATWIEQTIKSMR